MDPSSCSTPAEILGALLRGEPPETEAAFLVFEAELLFARCLRRPGEPDSAVLRLVLGVNEARPELARKILRRPIHFSGQPTELDWGALKVGAKRLRLETVARETTMPRDPSWTEVPSPASDSDTALPAPSARDAHDWMAVAEALASSVPRPEGRPLHEQSRAIGAVLVSAGDELLAWAANAGATNRLLHAELVMLRRWFHRTGAPVPAGARIFTTLKPCKMCAGAIWECAEDPARIQVSYRDFDPGPMGRSTVLDAGSFEHRRATSSPTSRKPGVTP